MDDLEWKEKVEKELLNLKIKREKTNNEIMDIKIKQVGTDLKIENYIKQSIKTEEQFHIIEEKFLKTISNVSQVKWMIAGSICYFLYEEYGIKGILKLLN